MKAVASKEVIVQDPPIVVDPGLNVFTVMTSDFEKVREVLESEGVRVLEANHIHGEQTTLKDLLLPGEDESILYATAPEVLL